MYQLNIELFKAICNKNFIHNEGNNEALLDPCFMLAIGLLSTTEG